MSQTSVWLLRILDRGLFEAIQTILIVGSLVAGLKIAQP